MAINAHRRTCKAAGSILLAGSKNYRKPFSRRNFSLKGPHSSKIFFPEHSILLKLLLNMYLTINSSQ